MPIMYHRQYLHRMKTMETRVPSRQTEGRFGIARNGGKEGVTRSHSNKSIREKEVVYLYEFRE